MSANGYLFFSDVWLEDALKDLKIEGTTEFKLKALKEFYSEKDGRDRTAELMIAIFKKGQEGNKSRYRGLACFNGKDEKKRAAA